MAAEWYFLVRFDAYWHWLRVFGKTVASTVLCSFPDPFGSIQIAFLSGFLRIPISLRCDLIPSDAIRRPLDCSGQSVAACWRSSRVTVVSCFRAVASELPVYSRISTARSLGSRSISLILNLRRAWNGCGHGVIPFRVSIFSKVVAKVVDHRPARMTLPLELVLSISSFDARPPIALIKCGEPSLWFRQFTKTSTSCGHSGIMRNRIFSDVAR